MALFCATLIRDSSLLVKRKRFNLLTYIVFEIFLENKFLVQEEIVKNAFHYYKLP